MHEWRKMGSLYFCSGALLGGRGDVLVAALAQVRQRLDTDRPHCLWKCSAFKTFLRCFFVGRYVQSEICSDDRARTWAHISIRN